MEENGMTPATLMALLNGDNENAIAAMTPGGIEAQEARGQQDFVNSETLPKDMSPGVRESLESIGVKFGDDFDDLFFNVELPEGWSKKPTDHSMHSDLIDEKGRKRAGIFYKAAFYDRNAHISLARRFGCGSYPEDQYKTNISYDERKAGNWYGMVRDQDDVIFKTEPIKGADFDEQDELSNLAENWLSGKYPDWKNDSAYWD